MSGAAGLPFEPDWAIHPGVSVRELLEELNVTPRVAAVAMGVTQEELEDVLGCRSPITPRIARGLARLPSSERFWLNLQRNYDDSLARGARDVTGDDDG